MEGVPEAVSKILAPEGQRKIAGGKREARGPRLAGENQSPGRGERLEINDSLHPDVFGQPRESRPRKNGKCLANSSAFGYSRIINLSCSLKEYRISNIEHGISNDEVCSSVI
jgi:hypothetical protein